MSFLARGVAGRNQLFLSIPNGNYMQYNLTINTLPGFLSGGVNDVFVTLEIGCTMWTNTSSIAALRISSTNPNDRVFLKVKGAVLGGGGKGGYFNAGSIFVGTSGGPAITVNTCELYVDVDTTYGFVGGGGGGGSYGQAFFTGQTYCAAGGGGGAGGGTGGGGNNFTGPAGGGPNASGTSGSNGIGGGGQTHHWADGGGGGGGSPFPGGVTGTGSVVVSGAGPYLWGGAGGYNTGGGGGAAFNQNTMWAAGGGGGGYGSRGGSGCYYNGYSPTWGMRGGQGQSGQGADAVGISVGMFAQAGYGAAGMAIALGLNARAECRSGISNFAGNIV